MKCFLLAILAFANAVNNEVHKPPIFKASKEIMQGNIGTPLDFGLPSVDCHTISDCHECSLSNCEWKLDSNKYKASMGEGTCVATAYSNGVSGEMEIDFFFKNAGKCRDKLNVCSTSQLKDSLPSNSSTNFTMGFTNPSKAETTIPDKYFCY